MLALHPRTLSLVTVSSLLASCFTLPVAAGPAPKRSNFANGVSPGQSSNLGSSQSLGQSAALSSSTNASTAISTATPNTASTTAAVSSPTSVAASTGSTVSSNASLSSTNTSSSPTPTSTTSSEAASTSTATSTASTSTYSVLDLTFPTVTASPAITAASYQDLTALIPSILSNGNDIATHSWELGALTETLLEVYNPGLAPFEWSTSASDDGNIPWNVLKIASDAIVAYNWTGAPSQETGNDLSLYLDSATTPYAYISQALVDGDGALGDPVSLVPAVWTLAKFAQNDKVKSALGLRAADDYAWMVGNQLSYLLAGTTSDNGTISQRDGYFELWSDMGYMISPSLSYIGLETSSFDYLNKSLTQYLLESSALLQTDDNIYLHILDWDANLWATGNGWMTYGLMRNLAAVKASTFSTLFSSKVTEAEHTVAKVFAGLFGQLDDDNLIPNYMLQSNATLLVGDTAGTALTVAAYYRFLKLAPQYTSDILTAKAESAFDGVVAKIDSDGWMTHCVDPNGTYGWVVYPDDFTFHSPEAQLFAAKMWKARTEAGC